jgi:glycosyltransferase involved in cell wall biosynthesis
MFGRLEDLDLKGIVFGVRAISAAVEMGRLSSSIEVRVRGSIAGEASDLREQLLAETEGHVDIVVRNYTTDQNELARELKLASLVLMPSRVEGFGLAGLEAIVAGTPVLVSQASGLGELLQEMLGPQSSAVVLGVDDAGAIQSWASAIELLLLDRDAAFDSAERIRTQLAALRTWAMAAAVVEGGLPT